ncbi:hypothetical protein B0H67DRAFT_648586 [Lasiosphaeris hirsuta]|uniref:DUF8035 domain-containing protein n=1 Tax=Lasiosphaeris hirsuta TaxID=260670 RepID=A0AA40A3I2_9PEZI|nr:hypothetical protein B0H67DRAFT_648586 [Lasiosphaeris hirsuta]
MSAFRSSVPDLSRGPERSERWDRDRFHAEVDRDRYGDVRERFEETDDHVYARGPLPTRTRERSERPEGRARNFEEIRDDLVARERRRVAYEDELQMSAPRRRSPETEVDRSVFIERERARRRSPSPPRRPGHLVRRPSSLDTFDRKPTRLEREYSPPASRRGDYHAPPYVPIPLPRSRGLPPPRVYDEEVTEEIRVDEEFLSYPGERIREKETIRTRRRRSRSRDSRRSRATSHRRRSSSRSSSSSSSISGGTAITSRSEYPKKGKTRIPARLVSKRALIELGYPFIEEGNHIIVQKALGQNNIDDLLKLSEDYKKSEFEVLAARSTAGDIIEERREERRTEYIEVPVREERRAEFIEVPARARSSRRSHSRSHSRAGSGAVFLAPRQPSPQLELVKTTTVVRDASPTRYTTASYDTSTSYDTTTSYDTGTSYDTYTTGSTHRPVVVDARPHVHEVSSAIPVGPLALVSDRHYHGSRSEDRSEIRHLERQLARHNRHERHSSRGELVRAERLSTGELVLYEEEVERVEEPSRGLRIEKDKKGRMSISVPKYSR